MLSEEFVDLASYLRRSLSWIGWWLDLHFWLLLIDNYSLIVKIIKGWNIILTPRIYRDCAQSHAPKDLNLQYSSGKTLFLVLFCCANRVIPINFFSSNFFFGCVLCEVWFTIWFPGSFIFPEHLLREYAELLLTWKYWGLSFRRWEFAACHDGSMVKEISHSLKMTIFQCVCDDWFQSIASFLFFFVFSAYPHSFS